MNRMTRWSVRAWLLAVAILPLAAAPAAAFSITTYGSIVITSLSNSQGGLVVTVPDDKATVSADTIPTCPVTPADAGPVTPDGGIKPPPTSVTTGPTTSPGTGATGNPDPVAPGTPIETLTPPGDPTPI